MLTQEEAIKLIRRAADAYKTVGSDGATKGIVRKWVSQEELIVTRVLLRTLLDRTPSPEEVEACITDL